MIKVVCFSRMMKYYPFLKKCFLTYFCLKYVVFPGSFFACLIFSFIFKSSFMFYFFMQFTTFFFFFCFEKDFLVIFIQFSFLWQWKKSWKAYWFWKIRNGNSFIEYRPIYAVWRISKWYGTKDDAPNSLLSVWNHLLMSLTRTYR